MLNHDPLELQSCADILNGILSTKNHDHFFENWNMQVLLVNLAPKDASVRLQHLIQSIPPTHILCQLTVSDYVYQKAVFLYRSLGYPRAGKKTVTEWCEYIERWLATNLLKEREFPAFDRGTLLDNLYAASLIQVVSFPRIRPQVVERVSSEYVSKSLPWKSVAEYQESRSQDVLNFFSKARGKAISRTIDLIESSINQSSNYEELAERLQCKKVDLILLGLLPVDAEKHNCELVALEGKATGNNYKNVLKSFENISLVKLFETGESNAFTRKMLKIFTEMNLNEITISDYVTQRESIRKRLFRQPGLGKKKVEELGARVTKFVFILLRLVGIEQNKAKYLSRSLCLTGSWGDIDRLSHDDIERIFSIKDFSRFDELHCIVDLGFNALLRIKSYPLATIDRLLKAVLTEKELFIIKNRYGLEGLRTQTLEQLGAILSVTRERVRQMEVKALEKLKASYRSRLLEIYVESNSNSIFRDLGLSTDYVSEDLLHGWRNQIDGYLILAISVLYGDLKKYFDQILERRESKRLGGTVWLKKGLADQTLEAAVAQAAEFGKCKNPVSNLRAILAAMTWPISIEAVLNKASWLSEEKVHELLENHLGATVDNGYIASIDSLRPAIKYVIILRTEGRAMTLEEIAIRHKQYFGTEVKEHNVGATVQRLDNALIVERGTYNIYENLELTRQEIEQVRDEVELLLKEAMNYISTKVLLTRLEQRLPYAVYQKLGSYMILGICQDDERFDCRRGFMIGLAEGDFQAGYTRLVDEIHDIVDEYGPISVPEIYEKISGTRDVFQSTIGSFLYSSKAIVSAGHGVYDNVDKVLGDQADSLLLAIQIILLDGKVGIPLLMSRLISTGFTYRSETISSFLTSCEFVSRSKNGYELQRESQDLKQYNEIFLQNYDPNLSYEQNKKRIICLCEDDDLVEFAKVDYRLHIPADEWRLTAEDDDDDSMIGSILSDFEF